MSKNNQKQIWNRLLHLSRQELNWVELPVGTPLSESVSWSISEIRPKGFTVSVLSLQHKSGRQWGSVLSENFGEGGTTISRPNRKRQTNNSKGIRPLSKNTRGI